MTFFRVSPMPTRFLSTPSARRATPTVSLDHRLEAISIHALREEGDERFASKARVLMDFYPRPPRGGRRTLRFKGSSADGFLSTPSARRATR